MGWIIPPQDNSQFVASMEQVLDVYKRPYSKEFPLICMDESPKQLIKETRIAIPMKPGQEARQDFEYERCGVSNIFMASEPLKGKRYVKVTERKTKVDWAIFIRELADNHYKTAIKITLVMDNLNTLSQLLFMKPLNPRKLNVFGIDLNSYTLLNMGVGLTWLKSNYMF